MSLFDLPIEKSAGKSNEWYTPSRYVEAAREVMGGIDLDPASCANANVIVRASRYFAKEEDGLKQSWHGRVWLNPPYGSLYAHKRISSMGAFVNKLITEYRDGNVTQAVVLVTIQIDAKWFAQLWNYPICFADHHVMFNLPSPIPKTSTHLPGRNVDSHMWGTAFIYLGPNEQKFVEVFSKFGRIAKAIDIPKMKPANLELWSA